MKKKNHKQYIYMHNFFKSLIYKKTTLITKGPYKKLQGNYFLVSEVFLKYTYFNKIEFI